MSATTITAFSADDLVRRLPELGALLHACVHEGASVGFVMPCGIDECEAFWRGKVLASLRAGSLVLLVARHGEAIAGTVQLDYDTMPNQRHRAEVRKLLVHPALRRQGIARALMTELERHAQGLQRRLLTLDTRTGDHAEPLYAALGYRAAGMIPGYARDTHSDKFDATTIMYKAL
ncbi:acetyltransferase domain protein [Paraburkholderia xenovorans LB400]|uniref:Acetyltransferase protein n=1 Tax=Paraburkholderia xenovorans (strain LB400) TaxID=266265 RepID=Q13MS9_PARXL|nr:GNAT family N-acetyltransferase [Paraburkholderia xenovorans]ABE34610.1 Putative acetyltransferase protein [Paraburkholderia xenovorans LB400]AIP36136.1 acetyltransferase domain protein [Paraburkholderia xenovorans LB400]